MRYSYAGWISLSLAVLIQAVHAEGLQARPVMIIPTPADGGRDGEVRRLIDSRMQVMIEDLLQADLIQVARKNLRTEGKRCVPCLLAALKDRRFQRIRPYGYPRRLPLADVLELLNEVAPEATVPQLVTLLKSPKRSVHREAAFFLGRTGTDDCVQPVLDVFAGTDGEMQRQAARGIAQAVARKKASAAFRAAVFEPLVALLGTDDDVPDVIPECLLKLDAERAAKVLMDDKYLDPSAPLLLNTLEAVEKTQAAVSVDRIISLLDKLRPDADSYPAWKAYGLGLRILAHNRSPETGRLIDDSLVWGNRQTRIMAMRARCVLEGIPDPDSYVYKAEDKEGFNRLSGPQHTMLYVLRLDYHMDEGGFEDFFSCSCGKNAAATASALEEIGALRAARLMQKAIVVFGPRGPSRNQERRDEQLAALSREQEEELAGLSGEFNEDQDDREVLLLQYALKHKDHFGISNAATKPE